MKKIIIIIGIILGLILINIFSLNSYYNNFKGNKLYKNKDFSGALNYFEKEKGYIGLYNLGNTNYRLGEQEKEDNKKIDYLQKSVDFYKNSLKLKYDPRTEYNYNFVLDKLKKLKKKLKEEKKQKEKNQNNKQNPEDKNNSGKSNESEVNKRGEEGKEQKDIKEGNKGAKLSQEAKKQIKTYEEKLKQDQKKNAGNFGKVYQENNRNDIFNNFNSFFEDDPFFNNSLLDNDEKKDW